MQYLKKASKSPATGEDETRATVAGMLRDIEAGGEARALHYAESLDGWKGDVVVSTDDIGAAAEAVPEQMRRDIRFAHERVKGFAEAQLASMVEFETELSPGLIAGQRLIPVDTAGCYVPGGRYAHIASALMSVATAKVAGVENVIACSPTRAQGGVHPAILYAADLAGADTVLALGGVQGIAALAFGLFTGHKADILVGRVTASWPRQSAFSMAGGDRFVRGPDRDTRHRRRHGGCRHRRFGSDRAGRARAGFTQPGSSPRRASLPRTRSSGSRLALRDWKSPTAAPPRAPGGITARSCWWMIGKRPCA